MFLLSVLLTILLYSLAFIFPLLKRLGKYSRITAAVFMAFFGASKNPKYITISERSPVSFGGITYIGSVVKYTKAK